VRRITTQHSIWFIDEERKMFCRLPKQGKAPSDHPILSYEDTSGWINYDTIEFMTLNGRQYFSVRGARNLDSGEIETNIHRSELDRKAG
jgi:hypothetical protein